MASLPLTFLSGRSLHHVEKERVSLGIGLCKLIWSVITEYSGIPRIERFGIEHGDLRWNVPSEVDGETRTARASRIVENHMLVDSAALIAQMCYLSIIELQRGIAMNETGGAVEDHLQRAMDSHGEGWRRRDFTFALIGLAEATGTTGKSDLASLMKSAGGARIAEEAR